MRQKLIDCGKCGGTGDIPAYRGIAGGVCFLCGGTGKRKVSASHQPSRKFVCIYGGAELFTVRAKTEAEALSKAVGHWRSHPNAPALRAVREEQISVREYA